MLSEKIVASLQCPRLHSPLTGDGHFLYSADKIYKYPITKEGIPQFAVEFCSEDGKKQQDHYDRVASAYLENLTYRHTIEYTEYLDEVFLNASKNLRLENVLEICSGRGEALRLMMRDNIRSAWLLDVSTSMLTAGRRELNDPRMVFVQGDATMMPFQSQQFDTVVAFGGIHHVNDRKKLFGEVFRVLKPGGKFFYREPVDDFIFWRLLRKIVYRISPALDADTEHPLRRESTERQLSDSGLRCTSWVTAGFLGFCVFMNSDVLVVNRLFRWIPGISFLVQFSILLDKIALSLPGMKGYGTQVIGVAEKPR